MSELPDAPHAAPSAGSPAEIDRESPEQEGYDDAVIGRAFRRSLIAIALLLFIGPLGGMVSILYAVRIEPLKALRLG